jgi:UDPglucose--hexose-1-phosphate uridylyltransferase
MNFESIAREAVLLDPNSDLARKHIPNEIRKDPLTGKTSRICHFRELSWKKPDLDKLVAGTESWCPFCPDKVLKVTPCFPEEIIPEGRMTLDDKVLFPNIAPYDRLSVVATLGERHYIPMTEIEPGRITDGFRLALKYFRHLDDMKHPESVYHLISWNYMPASGSSIIHPHLQVFASSFAPNFLREKLTAAGNYTAKHGSNFWDDLVTAEKANAQRYLGKIGRIDWLTVFAPLGAVGDVIAVVEGIRSTLELTEDDLNDLATGLTKLMAAYDRMGIYNFNMSFFSGSVADEHARFHMLFSPRIYFNPAIGTPDVAALGRMFGESVCMGFPEEINGLLKVEFG